MKKKKDKQKLVNPETELKRGLLRRQIIRPKTPHEQRISTIPGYPVPPEDSFEGALLRMHMERDVAFQMKMKAMPRIRWINARAIALGGSGFQMSKLLRYFFTEYENRIATRGFEHLPASFNVVEAFLAFERERLQFSIRDEIEHLLSIDDYFDWYRNQEALPETALIERVLRNGIIYSYDMRTQEDEYRLTGESEQRIAGISLVRHGSELCCALLAGERPPYLSDDEIRESTAGMQPRPGREDLIAESDFSIEDRYLDGAPEYSRVVLLTRFDLRTRKHDVRYVLIDGGISFSVLTDDKELFEDMREDARQSYYESSVNGLSRYQSLFSVAMSLIYLPIFVADVSADMREITVSTELEARLTERERDESRSVVSGGQLRATRNIRCLPMKALSESHKCKLSPPEFEFRSEGYWKPIGPTAIGEDQKGNTVIGRTWVSRHEQWTVKKPEDFILEKSVAEVDGPDPGFVYIQRSSSHAVGVYKIGLTRRSVEQRSKQLSSSTAAPLPFDILASFAVGDCGGVEAEAHRRLAPYRINPKREFFRADLRVITESLRGVIADICPKDQL